MGTNIKPLIKPKIIAISDLKGKLLAVDAHNVLYQFLTTIRSYDGSYLMDKEGNVTSHLIGLFYRTITLMEHGLKLCFVFDGKVPDLKKEELIRRRDIKNIALKKYEKAASTEDIEEMKKQAVRTTRLTPEMIKDAKKLLSLLGLPVIEALSEGEAQAANMVREGLVHAVISQDYDTLLFGCPRVIRNLTISKKRKIKGAYSSKEVFPELVELSQVLNDTGLDQDKLIALGIMTGTDYCKEGIKGIGPKKALKLLKEHSIEESFKMAGWKHKTPWIEIFDLIKNMKGSTNKLVWQEPDSDKLKELLVYTHGFDKIRVENSLAKLNLEQKGLSDFF